MFTPWTAYAVTIAAHRRELETEIASPRRYHHRPALTRHTPRVVRRHTARPATSA